MRKNTEYGDIEPWVLWLFGKMLCDSMWEFAHTHTQKKMKTNKKFSWLKEYRVTLPCLHDTPIKPPATIYSWTCINKLFIEQEIAVCTHIYMYRSSIEKLHHVQYTCKWPRFGWEWECCTFCTVWTYVCCLYGISICQQKGQLTQLLAHFQAFFYRNF